MSGRAIIEGAKGRISGVKIGKYWDDHRRHGWKEMDKALKEAGG